MMFDLPDPLGPEIVVKPSSSGTNVDFPNDLKLSNSISLIRKSVFRSRSPAALHYKARPSVKHYGFTIGAWIFLSSGGISTECP